MRSRPLPLAVILCVLAAAPGHALDTNGNGMSDVWELLHNQLALFPDASPFGPLEDADGDGRSNLMESIAGTDPFSGLPPLGVHGMEIAGAPWPPDTFRLTVPWSLPGKTYTLSTSPDLSSGSWTPFDPMAGNGAHLMVDVSPRDAQTNTLAERSFFRCDVADQPNPGGLFSPWELAVMADNPLIHAAIMELVNPPGAGNPTDPEEPPVIPNSDGSGPADPYDASPFDDEVNWYRTPEAKYLHIPVDGATGGFKAVDVSDSGRILLARTTPVADYTTDPVGLVWDPSAESVGRLIPVMFAPENFQLNFKVTTWNPGASSTHTAGTAPLPGPGTPSNRTVIMTVVMKAIAEDGSVIADVDYTLSEHGVNSEQPTRSGHAKLAFLWRQGQYATCRMLGENRGFGGTVENPSFTEDHAVGFHTSIDPQVTKAVFTHQVISPGPSYPRSNLAVETRTTTDLTAGSMNGHLFHDFTLPPEPVITRSGRIMIKNRVSASELNHILCGNAPTQVLPYDLESISDLPDLPGTTATWGIGQMGGPFRFQKGQGFDPIASLTGVLAFDRQGNGIGDGAQGRAIWRNARWHTLEAATGKTSLAAMEPKKITASGLIWIGDEGATSNALLVPVEVVTPALNHNEEEIFDRLFGAEELKVAKMEDSLDENGVLDIDADPHRFHVRIPSRLGGKPVVAKLGTSGNPDGAYNDPATEIPLTANPFQQESQSQLLVSDQADDEAGGNDEQAGDRTHRVQLGGGVEISEVKIGAVSYPFSMKVPVKVKRNAEVRVVFVGEADFYQTEFVGFVKIAKERFAQVGVELEVDYKSMPVPPAIANDLQVQHHDGFGGGGSQGLGNLVHADMKALVDAAVADPAVGRRDFTIFVVRGLLQPNPLEIERGKAVTKRLTATADQAYTRTVVLSAEHILGPSDAQTSWFTLGHELGHLLTNHGHYGTSHDRSDPDSVPSRGEYGPDKADPSVSRNLMKKSTGPDRSIKGNKRLLRDQEKMILKELGGTP
ncbi:MAG: hypothetical protein KF712_12890 [Akkermansiaceae bacterium]|nr:hypothetical protein [Akkermansiaceae bacterium]